MAKSTLSLTSIDLIGEAPAPDPTPPVQPTPVVQPGSVPMPARFVTAAAPPPPQRMILTYRPTAHVHEQIRTISFATRRPMQDLLDEAVLQWLQRQSAG